MAFGQALATSLNLTYTIPKTSLTKTLISSSYLNPLYTLRLSSPPSQLSNKNLKFNHRLRCSVGQNGHYNQVVAYPKPSEIPWNKEVCNSVHLIGVVGKPVEVKHLSSGKVVASTSLAVKKSATDTTWINLTFWDELAQVAFQHVEKGQQIYVSGRLVSDTVENSDGRQLTYFKVVVQQLNFVEKGFSSVSFNDQDTSSPSSGKKVGNYTSGNTGSTDELWQAFFANPVDWWDNRKTKRTPRYPDFKHKDTGEALWIEGRNNPPWAKSQLAILDSRMRSLNENNANMNSSLMAGDDFMPF